jgi:hypothetical protein
MKTKSESLDFAISTIGSLDLLRKTIAIPPPFEFQVRPQWQSSPRLLNVFYSIKATSSLVMGAVGAGVYWKGGSKLTTAANQLSTQWKVTEVDNWLLTIAIPDLSSVKSFTVGLVVVVSTAGMPKIFSYLEDISPPAIRSESISDDILNYCVSLDKAEDPVMTDCNAFVKKVGSRFGVSIPDLDADGIVGSFDSSPFTKTTKDPATAMSWAKEGLVVAGMTKSELNPKYGTKYKNGHVAIVHGTEDPDHPGYPMASWGSLGGRGQSDASIRQSFPAAACNDDAVHFAFAATS